MLCRSYVHYCREKLVEHAYVILLHLYINYLMGVAVIYMMSSLVSSSWMTKELFQE
jgi:hypothetical protein